MRHIVTTLLCTLLLSVGLATTTAVNAQRITYAGIPWGSDVATVKNKMVAAGFTFDKTDSDGDLEFRNGIVLDTKTAAFAMFHKGGLAKIQINMATPDEKAVRIFHEMREMLIKDSRAYPDYSAQRLVVGRAAGATGGDS